MSADQITDPKLIAAIQTRTVESRILETLERIEKLQQDMLRVLTLNARHK